MAVCEVIRKLVIGH